MLLAVNLVRSPIRLVTREDGLCELHCFADGLVPFKAEVWQDGRLVGAKELEPGLVKECHVPCTLAIPAADFKLTLLLKSIQEVPPVISQGRMMAGCQVNMVAITASRDVKIEEQRILLGAYEMDLFEIFGQPHSLLANSVNRSVTSLYSGSLGDGPGLNRECVICLSHRRDTVFLPCRHMCLCLSCAESLCLQSDKCPICRQGTTVCRAACPSGCRVPVDAEHPRGLTAEAPLCRITI